MRSEGLIHSPITVKAAVAPPAAYDKPIFAPSRRYTRGCRLNDVNGFEQPLGPGRGYGGQVTPIRPNVDNVAATAATNIVLDPSEYGSIWLQNSLSKLPLLDPAPDVFHPTVRSLFSKHLCDFKLRLLPLYILRTRCHQETLAMLC